ncbi:DUF3800 domain-containing protein [Gordonia sp. VNQ95]|uniref:DUF3800 domain-containing protein n=1 Tax=Gordonia sp. VNQ95 TaxID=3156619 RepID=UPI0032B460A9
MGKRLYAYIDETGDRGTNVGSSPIFGMAAVIVDDASARTLREAVKQLRSDFGVPDGKVMSWKEHVKNHDRRRRAAAVLGSVAGLTVCLAYADKSALSPSSYRSDKVRFYNYVAWMTYKSILWSARSLGGNSAEVWTRFGHVKHHDHEGTKEYLEREAERDDRVPHQMEQGLRWVSADQYLESQAADLYGGFMRAALWPTEWNLVEPAYLLAVWHQLRNSHDCAIPLGFMSMPDYSNLYSRDWFPCATCKRKPAR